MRLVLLANTLLIFAFLTFPVAAQNSIDIERADVATGLFQKACFMNFNKKEQIAEFLDSKFYKHDDPAKKQLFLDFTKTEKGDVWIAAFPKGIFAFVLSDKGNCHLIAQKADREKIHANIEKLANEAEKNLEFKIEKHERNSGTATKSNGFNVMGSSGQNIIVVVASTPLHQSEDKPDAIITMAVESY